MKIFIVIVIRNSEKDILHCLKSIFSHKIHANILVIDNASTDRSISIIRSLQAEIQNLELVKNKKNLGFAAANNIGIKLAIKNRASHILLLNPDTEVEEDFLPAMIKNGADIVGPIIKFKRGGRWIYDVGGYVNYMLGRCRHKELLRRPKRIKTPEYVTGACMLIKRKVFEKIGYLDENYFLYFEDADFCLRAKKAGLKVAVERKAEIIHKLKEGKGKSIRKNYHLLKSNLIFINKHISYPKRVMSYVYWVALLFKIMFNTLM